MNSQLPLFQRKEFISHTGLSLSWKIDCDALNLVDLDTLAFIASKEYNHCKIIGIPTGGLKFAQILREYQTEPYDSTLIVDDVLTTGKSFNDMLNLCRDDDQTIYPIKGLVIFARSILYPGWITTIFTLNSLFTHDKY